MIEQLESLLARDFIQNLHLFYLPDTGVLVSFSTWWQCQSTRMVLMRSLFESCRTHPSSPPSSPIHHHAATKSTSIRALKPDKATSKRMAYGKTDASQGLSELSCRRISQGTGDKDARMSFGRQTTPMFSLMTSFGTYCSLSAYSSEPQFYLVGNHGA